MADPREIAAKMKRGDWATVENAIATNGGGIWAVLLPEAKVKRLVGLGLLRHKSAGQCKAGVGVTGVPGLLIHGPNAFAVRAALKGQGNG